MLTKRLIVTATAALVVTLGAAGPGFADGDDHPRDEGRQGPPPPMPPGPGGGLRGEGRPGSGGMLADEHVDAIIEVLKDADPDTAEKVENARRNNLREVRELIAPKGMQLFQMVQLKKSDPEIYALRIEEYKLNRKIEGIAQQIRKGDGKVDADKEKEIKELLAKQFDLRQQTREKELQRLEKKVLEVREGINRRKAEKERILKERFKTVTEKPQDKDW